jgi:2-oxo-4-hydroxy-4-carboxy-5-ureidoimidazoline decarboxylase
MYHKNVPSQMSRDNFLTVFGGIYENSHWIAEQLYDSGLKEEHNTALNLQLAMAAKVELAGYGPQLALLRTHPDLAGKLAISGKLTDESTSEQASADLGNCTAEEFGSFQSLNDQYKEKFGFPFILAVRGYHRSEILEIFETRINNDPATEFNDAMTQVHKIALLRLNEIE